MDVPGHSPFLGDIREDRRLDGNRILVVTARAVEEEVVQTWDVGDDVLIKPIDSHAVVDAAGKLAGPPRKG